jgi:hypothetical protein
MMILEIWSGRGHALATLGGTLMPAIDAIAQAHTTDLLCVHTEHQLRRIVFSDEVVSAFGY